jgi:Luciferase-like monooxygenase
VLLLPYHHPVVLAKRLATIDVLSRGRMSPLTVGLGVLPGEAAAAGVGFATRGRRADEAIDCSGCCGAGTRPASTSPASSSPCPQPAASPSRMTSASCLSMSADRAWLLPGGQAAAATATSPAAG